MYWTFVQNISSKSDKYGFVNENEIRIATWIKLVLGLFAFFLVLFKAEYQISLVIIGLIWLDFVLQVFISPKMSIFGSIVRLCIKKREPLWVGSVQKRFAWAIGLVISSFVLFCILVLWKHIGTSNPALEQVWITTSMNIQNWSLIVVPMNPAILACLVCLVFMWFESVVGYCVWCSIYAWLVKKGVMKKHHWQNCINWQCDLP